MLHDDIEFDIGHAESERLQGMIAAQGLHPDQMLTVRVTFPPHGQGEARSDIIPTTVH